MSWALHSVRLGRCLALRLRRPRYWCLGTLTLRSSSLTGDNRCQQTESPARLFGRGSAERALLAVLARPRPKQGVAFAALVVEQVRVDRRIEGRVIELEREIVATFLGALRPGGSDLSVMWCTT